MEAGSDVVRRGKLATCFEAINDLISVWKIRHVVATFSMRLHWKYLAVDSKAANSVVSTELKCCLQCVGIRHAESRQLHESIVTTHLSDGSDGRVAKLDRLLVKDTAQAEP
jgi:hypothetical protein